MAFSPTSLASRPVSRRWCAGVTLFAYLIAAGGIPLPAAAPKRNGERFPCENNPCGCATAEQCWKSCCCTTPEERFAWARENGVQPPSYAEQPFQGCGHCDEPRGSCCTTSQSDNPTKVKWVFGLNALKCQGHANGWTNIGIVVPPPVATSICFDEIIERITMYDASPQTITFAPQDPPPRSLAGF